MESVLVTADVPSSDGKRRAVDDSWPRAVERSLYLAIGAERYQ